MNLKNKIKSVAIFTLLVSLFFTRHVEAHAIGQRLGDFYGGLLHPILILRHVLPLIALSLVAGQHGAEVGRKSLYIFLGSISGGAIISVLLPPISSVLFINELSLVITGLMVAIAYPYSKWIIYLLVLLFGFTHGYENGLELSASESPPCSLQVLYAVGLSFFHPFRR